MSLFAGLYLFCFIVGTATVVSVLRAYRNPPLRLIFELALKNPSPFRVLPAGMVAGLVANSLAEAFASELAIWFAADIDKFTLLMPATVICSFVGLLLCGLWELSDLHKRMGFGGAMLYLRWLNRGAKEPFNLRKERELYKRLRAQRTSDAARASQKEPS